MIIFWILGFIRDVYTHPLLLMVAAAGASWVFLFRPRLKIVPLGFLAFVAAVYLEALFLPVGFFWELVFAAPVLEEILKFLANRSKDVKGGIASGLGFAIMENTAYFLDVLSSPFFLYTVIIRSFSDVMMHSFNSGLSSFSYRRKGRLRFGLLLAMLIHAAFNLGTLEFENHFTILVIYLGIVFALMLPGILLLTKMKGRRRARSAMISPEISVKN